MPLYDTTLYKNMLVFDEPVPIKEKHQYKIRCNINARDGR